MVKIVIGKMDGSDMLLYSPSQQYGINGKPDADDIVEENGKIFVYRWNDVRVDVTHEFKPGLGLPITKEDVL